MNVIAPLVRNCRRRKEKSHANPKRDATVKVLDAWESFEVSEPFKEKGATDSVNNTRWALLWKTMDGERCAKARPVAKCC